jgi:hypothetical protein
MEHVQTAARLMRPGDVLFTFDLKAGYHQFPVTAWFKKFLCFEWQGVVYRWRVMPFGLSTAPRAFSKLTRALVKRWRTEGARCSNFIDDFICAARPAEVAAVRGMMLRDLDWLGIYISPSKSMLNPGTLVQYLGVVLCTAPVPHVRMPDAKIVKLKYALHRILLRKARGLYGCWKTQWQQRRR